MATKNLQVQRHGNGSRRPIQVLLLSILFVGGCANAHNTIPIAQAEKELGLKHAGGKPQIVVVGSGTVSHGDRTYHVAQLVLVNPLDVPIRYYGYRMDSWQTQPPLGEISPFYSLQIKTNVDPTWHEGLIGRCGTGADMMVVPPKHAGRFNARIELPVLSAKIGFDCSWEDAKGPRTEKLWSANLMGSPDAQAETSD